VLTVGVTRAIERNMLMTLVGIIASASLGMIVHYRRHEHRDW
jgi:hypothetical protein